MTEVIRILSFQQIHISSEFLVFVTLIFTFITNCLLLLSLQNLSFVGETIPLSNDFFHNFGKVVLSFYLLTDQNIEICLKSFTILESFEGFMFLCNTKFFNTQTIFF